MIKHPIRRIAGLIILASCTWWVLHAYDDFSQVSPIHWGLMAPWAILGLVPVLVGAAAGGLLIYRGRGGKTLFLAFFLTAVQAVTVAVLSPGIRGFLQRHRQNSHGTAFSGRSPLPGLSSF